MPVIKSVFEDYQFSQSFGYNSEITPKPIAKDLKINLFQAIYGRDIQRQNMQVDGPFVRNFTYGKQPASSLQPMIKSE